MKLETVSITLQDRLDLTEEDQSFLDRLMSFHQDLKRRLFQDLYGSEKPADLNAFKRHFKEKYKITSTQHNSLKNQCDGIYKSQLELNDHYLKNYQDKEESILKWLEHKKSVLLRAKERQQKSQSDKSLRKIKLTQFKIHHKKRFLADIQRRKEKLESKKEDRKSFTPKVCFGSRYLLRKRQLLKENNLTEDQWRDEWEFTRSNSVFFLGDSTELSRNREVKGVTSLCDDDTFNMGITIPYALRDTKSSTFKLSPQKLSDRSLKMIKECLSFSYMREVKRNGKQELKEATLPISYRIKKRRYTKQKFGKTISETRYYLQTIIQVPVIPKTRYGNGALGVDINADHLAISIVDRFGNYQKSFSLSFRPFEANTSQNDAALGAIIHDLCDLADKKDVPIVLEKLDLSRLMSKLRQNHGKRTNRKLSSLSYSKMQTLFKTICARRKIKLLKVFAGYSSMLGAINYLNLRKQVSSHEAAALVIARRGMGFKDYLDISQLKYCAPDGHEILSSLQGGLAGPAVLRRKGIRDKIDFIKLKGLFMQFALDRNLEQELGFTRSHVFSSEMKIAAGT